jgi:glutamyl-Q tRNA(Asp) synthetase
LTFTDAVRGSVAVDPMVMGDAVIARKDVPASYQLAVVVDDAAQGVTLVTRGLDLFEATHLQRLLQASLGLPEPGYHHHRLILNDAGERLSKRDGAQALAALRAAGVTPAEVRARLGFGDGGVEG